LVQFQFIKAIPATALICNTNTARMACIYKRVCHPSASGQVLRKEAWARVKSGNARAALRFCPQPLKWITCSRYIKVAPIA
jgi:hypothetical protein